MSEQQCFCSTPPPSVPRHVFTSAKRSAVCQVEDVSQDQVEQGQVHPGAGLMTLSMTVDSDGFATAVLWLTSRLADSMFEVAHAMPVCDMMPWQLQVSESEVLMSMLDWSSFSQSDLLTIPPHALASAHELPAVCACLDPTDFSLAPPACTPALALCHSPWKLAASHSQQTDRAWKKACQARPKLWPQPELPVSLDSRV